MEQQSVSERLLFENARILFYRVVYPKGISERADRYYAEAADAFTASCRGNLYLLALEDYKSDKNPRKKYRHRQWEASFVCETVEEDSKLKATLTIMVNGNGVKLRREYEDIWSLGAEYMLEQTVRV